MLLIGLGAKARQGKNYVANYMKEQNNAIKLYAFADELKLYCKEHHSELVAQWCEAGPEPFRMLQPPKDDPIYGYTQILQWYGTNIARRQNPNTWVDALSKRLEDERPAVAIIPDVRFQNEAEYIKEKGGYLVEVIRLNADGTQYLDPGRDPKHESETALDDYEGWDFVIEVKDGDLKGLKAKSIGVYNLASKPDDYSIYQYVDEPREFSDEEIIALDDLNAELDSQSDGFKS